HMLGPHVGTVNVVWTENSYVSEVFASEIDCEQFTDDFAATVAIPGIQRIGDRESDCFIRRNYRCGLIHFGTGRQGEGRNLVFNAAVNHVGDSLYSYFQNAIGDRVKEFSPIYVCQVAYAIHPPSGVLHCVWIADITKQNLYVGCSFAQSFPGTS